MPEPNLVPMMDVILTILTFFIIVSMTLTNQQTVDVALPSADDGTSQQRNPDPLIIGLNQQGQILLENKLVNEDRLTQQMESYLLKNPKGAVILQADRKLPYEQVVQVLGTMRDIGGDRISLGVDQS